MRRLSILLTSFLLAACTAVPTRASAPPAGAGTVADAAAAFSDEQVMAEINAERRRAGLVELNHNPTLERAALRHSADMAARDYLSHDVPDGPRFAERAATIGYPYREMSENVARGYTTPRELVAGWMASPGHRAAILNPIFRDIGIGLAVGQHNGRPTVSADAMFGVQIAQTLMMSRQ